jgi:hypothetical protein
MWIDAICINQDDNLEKSLHVPYIWTIYKHASRTIVWLGPENDQSDIAMQRLKHIGQQTVLLPNGVRFPAPKSDLDIYQDPYPSLNGIETIAIAQLLDRQYFQRLWIISELAMADVKAELHCGSEVMSLVDFRTALKCLSSSPTRPPLALLKRLRDIKALASPSSSTAFSVMLELYRHHQCSKPLDKVYGLISMASKAFEDCIDINYEIGHVELYRMVFLAAVKFFERLDLLQACRLDLAFEHGPSWVPDFSRSYKYWRPLEYCSGCSEPEYEVVSDCTIRVSGVRCCTVKNVVSNFSFDGDLKASLLACWKSTAERSDIYPTSESLQEALYRTICLDRTDTRYPRSSDMENRFKTTELEALLNGIAAASQGDPGALLEFQEETLLAQLANLLDGRDYYETSGGHFGLGPGISEEGMKPI